MTKDLVYKKFSPFFFKN